MVWIYLYLTKKQLTMYKSHVNKHIFHKNTLCEQLHLLGLAISVYAGETRGSRSLAREIWQLLRHQSSW